MKIANRIIPAILILTLAAACAQTPSIQATPVPPTAAPLPTATPAPTLQPADLERVVTVDGAERSYQLHIPPGMTAAQPAPLVFVFHGYGGDPSLMKMLTGFNDTSDKNAFLVVYPSGLSRSWNAGQCCGTAQIKQIDEPAFVKAILEDVATIVSVDPKRVYASGFSNGGMLSYRLGCEMSDTFAAIAPVGGAMTFGPCEPSQAVSVFHVHALDDADVRYEGGEFPSVQEGLLTWVGMNECTASPQIDEQLDGQLTHTAYAACKNGTAVELYAFETGGHAWPSVNVWNASQSIWDFFAAHPKP